MPYGGTTPEQDKKIDECIAQISGTNPRTKKPYTKSEKIAICKSRVLKKSENQDEGSYRCECLECGHIQNSDVHCNEAVCEECGSEDMRRVERPGVGKEKRNNDVEDSEKMSEEFTMSLSNMKAGKFETLESDNEEKRKMRFELMDDSELYNGVRFTAEALKHQFDIFKEEGFKVSHGVDHSGNTFDQLGLVVDMEIEYDEENEVTRCFITSEHYNETPEQQKAAILFQQGLLDYISGGWRAKIKHNAETEEFEVYNPILREVSSTPIPAKTSAKTIQDICNSLMFNENILSEIEAPDIMEESEMEDEDQEIQPSQPEGEEVEQSAEFSALKEKQEKLEKKVADMQSTQDEAVKASLVERAVKLGLSEEDLEGMSNTEIENTLKVANKVQMSTLREISPDIQLGGDPEGGSAELSDEQYKELRNKMFPGTFAE